MISSFQNFESCGIQDIEQIVADIHQPKFRAKQLLSWVYAKNARSYDEMSNIPRSLREQLTQELPLHTPTIVSKQVSTDGTRKYVLQLADKNLVETVGIPDYSQSSNHTHSHERLTVCFSTQVGCPMKCAFCATGQQGFTRNLYPGEIVQQILVVQRDFGIRVSNAVGMGQGEPFLNFKNLTKALQIIHAHDLLNLGARHITISTCGIPQAIRKFGEIPEQYTLALSLHSAIQEKRNKIMPGCTHYSLEDIRQALISYYSKAGRRISIEYLLIKGINNSDIDIENLEHFCHGLHVHINIIMLNNIPGSPFHPVSRNDALHFAEKIKSYGIETTIRHSRGSDIDGACGQLLSEHMCNQ